MRRALSFVLIAFAGLAQAEVRLHPLFTDHMVLQRGVSAPIWGWASPGEKVSVKGTWASSASAQTTAGPDGKWMARLRTGPAAGGPHELTVQGSNTVTVRDVMLGEVWLCSGQSNMEWPGRLVFPKAPAGEFKGEGNDRIRYFNVPNVRASSPKDTVEAKWEACTAESAPHHSAAGYYFAQRLFKELGTPVGLIESDWGGTEVEVWIREGALRTLPGFDARIDQVKQSVGGANSIAAWQQRLAQMEKGLGSFEKPEFDDSAWATAQLGPWESNGMPDFDGYVWYRAKFELDLGFAGLPLHLELGEIDDEDLTFVNGTKVGETKVWNAKRVYQVPADVLRTGTNVLAVRVLDTGGGGGFTTPNQIRLQVGDHECKLTPWKMKVSVNLKDTNPPAPARWPAADLYNGMIAPLRPYAIKGALWYQGESNVGRAYQYRQTFPLMIQNWREDFRQGDFPFFFVQIAPWNGYGGGGASAELREAQLMTLALKNTGMVVCTDSTDDYADIHPVNKWAVGSRLAGLALNRVYGKRGVDSGPTYRSFKAEGNTIRVTFDSVGTNLEVRGGDLTDLMIAGEDKKFVPAKCRLDRNTMVVWADGVSKPAAVRYGWSDSPKPGLFNSAGLPASPFRTDRWPGVTERAGW